MGYAYIYTPTSGSISGTDNPYTLHMPNADVTISLGSLRSTGKAVEVSYIDADGTPQTAQAIALDGTETSLGTNGQEKWYFVGTDISHTGLIDCSGEVNLILADGCNMSEHSIEKKTHSEGFVNGSWLNFCHIILWDHQ